MTVQSTAASARVAAHLLHGLLQLQARLPLAVDSHVAMISIAYPSKISAPDTLPQVEDAVDILDDGYETLSATKDLHEQSGVAENEHDNDYGDENWITYDLPFFNENINFFWFKIDIFCVCHNLHFSQGLVPSIVHAHGFLRYTWCLFAAEI